MNSPFANIYRAIQARLKNDAPYLKYVDQELGQLKQARPAVAWPCLLIDFEDFSFGNLSENVQTAVGTIVLRLGFAPYSSANAATPITYAEKALNYYDIEWDIHRLMQGWHPLDDTGSLCRTSTTTQKRSDSYRVREMRYSLAFEDYSTKNKLIYVPAKIVITEELALPTSAS